MVRIDYRRKETLKEAEMEMMTETYMVTKVPLALYHLKRLVAMMQTDFQYVWLMEESTWQVVVLIPKGGGEYLGIGLVEVVWKVVTVVINFHLTTSIDFHDVLHGFWACSSTGTTSLEAKLLH